LGVAAENLAAHGRIPRGFVSLGCVGRSGAGLAFGPTFGVGFGLGWAAGHGVNRKSRGRKPADTIPKNGEGPDGRAVPVVVLTLERPMLLAQIADTSSKGIDRLVDAATQGNNFWWLMLFGMIVVTTAISRTTSAVKAASREKTRREIAAFIAEGSMTPEQGEKLMKAGEKPEHC